ncbi:MAG: hypothetical protein ABMA01_02930 [Chthoniobacteraceae bacterium]
MLLKFQQVVPVRSASGEVTGFRLVPREYRIAAAEPEWEVRCTADEGWRPVDNPARGMTPTPLRAGNQPRGRWTYRIPMRALPPGTA